MIEENEVSKMGQIADKMKENGERAVNDGCIIFLNTHQMDAVCVCVCVCVCETCFNVLYDHCWSSDCYKHTHCSLCVF